jgi:hypothetical protein
MHDKSGIPKMSEALRRIAEMSFRDPEARPSSEAAHAALLFAHVGWNRALGFGVDGYEVILRQFVESRPQLWSELRSSDPHVLIEAAYDAKLSLYAADRRVVLVCGIRDERVHVEWCEEQKYQEAVRLLKRSPGVAAGALRISDERGA